MSAHIGHQAPASLIGAVLAGTALGAWPPSLHQANNEAYWEAHQIVTLAVFRSASGEIDSTVVATDAGHPTSADSILRTFSSRVPSPPTAHSARESHIDYFNISLDPRAESLPMRHARLIPQFALPALGQRPFSSWLKVLMDRDSTFGVGAFVEFSVARLTFDPL